MVSQMLSARATASPSVSDAYKPMSIAMLLLGAWGLSSRPVRDAWRRREALPFYALGTLAMWMFALGPTARLAGARVLYKAPYSWLMLLPGFADGFRAPARFAMLAALGLSAAAALAVARLTPGLAAGTRVVITGVAALGVLADGLVYPFPFEPAPAPLDVPAAVPAEAAVLELPIGVFEDAAAMYHGTEHGRPVANGLSGLGLHPSTLPRDLRTIDARSERTGLGQPDSGRRPGLRVAGRTRRRSASPGRVRREGGRGLGVPPR